MKKKQIQARLAEIQARANALRENPESATDGEVANLTAELAKLNGELKAIEENEAALANLAAATDKLNEPNPRVTSPGPVTAGARDLQAESPWKHPGEFFAAVKNAKLNPGATDKRLVLNAPATSGREGVNEDGGFAVPTDVRTTIIKQVMGPASLLSLTENVGAIAGNRLELPIDKTTPWGGVGIQAYWVDEEGAITPSKPKLGKFALELHKLAALVPMTSELLEDAPGIEQWLNGKVADVLVSKINTAIIRGSGNGTLEGLLNAPSKITQAAIGGQGANTFTAANAVDMETRLPDDEAIFGRAIWLMHKSARAALLKSVVTGTVPTFPPFVPKGIGGAARDQLLGRDAYVVGACSSLGTEGDVILWDPKSFLSAVKGSVRNDISIHVYFDTDHVAYRWILRIGGRTLWDSKVSPEQGSLDMSTIITLNSSRT